MFNKENLFKLEIEILWHFHLWSYTFPNFLPLTVSANVYMVRWMSFYTIKGIIADEWLTLYAQSLPKI